MLRSDSPADDLAPLPFGKRSAITFDDVASCTAFLERLPDHPSVFDGCGGQTDFRIRMRTVSLPGVMLLAGSSTPKIVRHESPRAALVIPFGACGSAIRIGRTTHRWASPHHAFFIPAGEFVEAESTAGSFLRLDLDESSLVRVAAGGMDDARRRMDGVDLRKPRIVPLRTAAVDWQAHVHRICASIDELGCDEASIRAAGIDDFLLRSVLLMLAPKLREPRQAGERGASSFDLDPLLEQLVERLGEPITLSDMEEWTGRSARTIQLAFKRRFGIGPMRWLLERRLDAIHARLSSADVTESVGQIARECGIRRAATLAAEYTRRFGLKPGDRGRKRPG